MHINFHWNWGLFMENVPGILIPRNQLAFRHFFLTFPRIITRIYAQNINQHFRDRNIFSGHWRSNGISEKMSCKVMNGVALYNASRICINKRLIGIYTKCFPVAALDSIRSCSLFPSSIHSQSISMCLLSTFLLIVEQWLIWNVFPLSLSHDLHIFEIKFVHVFLPPNTLSDNVRKTDEISKWRTLKVKDYYSHWRTNDLNLTYGLRKVQPTMQTEKVFIFVFRPFSPTHRFFFTIRNAFESSKCRRR